jgi:hypothetical protein
MTHFPRPRKTVNLSDSMHQYLNMYALAASAAGVGALALSKTCSGQDRLYTANVTLTVNQPWCAQNRSC